MNRTYEPAKDWRPSARLPRSPFILVATPTLKASSLGDVIKLAKAEPGRISIGHGGNGTAMQLAAHDVRHHGQREDKSGALSRHRAGGHRRHRRPCQLGIADPPPSMGAISEGKLKAIAVSSKQRFPMFPDIPTFDEQGLKDFEITGWFGSSRRRRHHARY